MRIVTKIGSSVLTGKGQIFQDRLEALVDDIAHLAEHHEIVIVSSGAVASGKEYLDTTRLKKHAQTKQILAAVGQPHLMARYITRFAHHHQVVAQVLITRDDLNHRQHYLNARDTLLGLLSQGIIPIVNENDVVAHTAGVEQFDNDSLAALVSLAVDADRLLIVFNGDGFLINGTVIKEIIEITDEIRGAVTREVSSEGRGGMGKKLAAIALATKVGIPVNLIPGHVRGVCSQVTENVKSIGTYFSAATNTFTNRQKWLLAGAVKKGSVTVDAKAVDALRAQRSLLPVGIKVTTGDFNRGDVIDIHGPGEVKIGAGIANYSIQEIEQIKGHPSSEIKERLGYTLGDEVIHRDHMVML